MKVEIIVIQTPAFCPVTECSECDSATCSAERQRAGRIADLQAKYESLETQLNQTAQELREAIIHG